MTSSDGNPTPNDKRKLQSPEMFPKSKEIEALFM